VICRAIPFLVLTLTPSITLTAQDPAILQVHVVEGDGAVYGLGSRATRGVTIQVTDEAGKPVGGATVTFRLPDSGSTGTFPSGSKIEVVATRADGRAAAWGMQWNRTSGPLEIRITAVKGQTRAGILCAQSLTNSPDHTASSAHMSSGGGHRWLWIAVAVAGAAGGAVAGVTVGGKTPASTASTVSLQIGAPTIIIGHP
jgi:hypothetical protein